ncbi:elongation of very long chain fatty acids protein AAEL008004-like [Tribolium madens]|uniref:elongation of very long chain fatty acids protein AAEL008004-like n=1 Tax=Tribolium madens TaxID=41895 RepID=UPI001CF72A01|nr:elongation of very long chain fatty acids protein AAEL008004-like [Tribolium madens]
MALLLKKMFQGYFWLFSEKPDPRCDGFFLMSSPLQPIIIGVGYLYLIYKFLPKFMEKRPPFKLDSVLIVFNLIQVFINAYICFYAGLETLKLNWLCAPIDYSITPHNMFVMRLVYLYFLTKIADLMDTIFFLLRGKTNQVSFLHVYHHFGMIGLSWTGVKFMGGGHSIFLGFVNTFVHTVMYFYYLLTIWKPEYKSNIWWKKHITHLQLIQFVFFLFIYGQLLFKPDCAYPKIVSYMVVPQSLFMIALFSDFYWKAYIRPKKSSKLAVS